MIIQPELQIQQPSIQQLQPETKNVLYTLEKRQNHNVKYRLVNAKQSVQ